MLDLVAAAALALSLCFATPAPVRIDGYTGDVMEPFISRDGATLFFNNSNDPPRQTNLYWATRIDDAHFRFRGPALGANSNDLDGVASMARDGTFAFISPRLFGSRHATIWTGRWTGAALSQLHLEDSLSPGGRLGFNMDAEISASGAHLYFTDNEWGPGVPRSSKLHVAVFSGGAWRRSAERDAWFASINANNAFVYAPATSADELELFFTQLTRAPLRAPHTAIMVATRARPNDAFGLPARVAAISEFVEGPTVAPDGALYFHKRVAGRFRLFRSARNCG